MVVAVIYTGGARTIRDTLPQLIWCCDNSNEEVHIFASLDNTTPSLDEFVVTELSHRLKAYLPVSADSNSDSLVRAAERTGLSEHHVQYLARQSGSIIEYKQIKTAADALVEYEAKENIRYACIYRTRPDIYQTSPFNDVTATSDQIVHELLKRAAFIRTEPDAQLALAMASLHHKNRMLSDFSNTQREYLLSTKADNADLPKTMRNALLEGKFLIAYRLNTYFVLGREALPALTSVFENYGKMRPAEGDPALGNAHNWWDAEHQMFYALRDHDVMYATTATPVERCFDYTFRSEMFDESKHSVHSRTPAGAFFFWRPPFEAWSRNAVL